MVKWLLAILLGISFLLRVVALEHLPVGFTPDEASFGYDAYSLLKTGKDQWGNAWPISFRSFGDFKLPAYTYLALPSVAVFGLNEFAVRFPSALVGVLAVFSTYLLANELFKSKKLALFAGLLLAISPWHMALSRGAFEANLTVFFMSFAVWAFLKGVNKRSYMVLSAIFFGLNLFTYHSARLVTPLLLLVLVMQNRVELGFVKISDFKKVIVKNWLPLAIFSTLLLIALLTLITGSGARASDVTIFSPTDKWMSVYDTRYDEVFDGMPYKIAVFFSNKLFDVISKFVSAYATYISPQFLFTQGASEWTYGMLSGHGALYLFEFAFIVSSLWFIAKNGLGKLKNLTFLLIWILVAIIPAALTKGPGYAGNRAAVVMPAIQIFSAFGGLILFDFLSKKIGKKITLAIYIPVIIFSLIFFLEGYIYRAPRSGADGMLYGREEVGKYISENGDKYKQIIVSRTLSEPQIFIAFYLKYDPTLYQKDAQDWLRYKEMGVPFVDQLGEYHLGKFVFKNINYIDDSKIPDVLLVGKPIEFPDRIIPVKEILYPNQNPALFVVDPEVVSFLKQ